MNTRIGKFLFFVVVALFIAMILYQRGNSEFTKQESLVRGLLVALVGANAYIYGSKYPILISWLIEKKKLKHTLVIGWVNIISISIIGCSLILLTILLSKDLKDCLIIVSCIIFFTLTNMIHRTIRIGTLFAQGKILDMHGMVIIKGEEYQYWDGKSFVNIQTRWFVHEDKTHICFTQGLNPKDTLVIPVWRVRAA